MSLTDQENGQADALVARVAAALDGGRFGLAVSGGGDSMALMQLAAAAGVAAEVATVDHGLRPEAADEARMVGAQAAALGFRHEILHWNGKAAQGNLPDAGRRARRQLLAGWAARRGLDAVVLAHTADDLAETFLMRLARGAGVDGLSAMAAEFQAEGMRFLRPLLPVRRQALRDWLAAHGIDWIEDPTNDDPHYDRTRARAALAALAPIGVSVERLGEVAGHLAEARTALEAARDALLREAATVQGEGLALRLDRARLFAAPAETRRRALVAIILWLAPAPYGPRGAQVQGLADRLAAGKPAQLQGVRFFDWKGALWACREEKALGDARLPANEFFDSRWRIAGAPPPDCTLGPLGAEGLKQCPDWRETGLPRAALLAAPALWRGESLLAAPHAGKQSPGIGVICRPPAHPAARRRLSH